VILVGIDLDPRADIMNVLPGCQPVRFSQIPERTRLEPFEAVALILAAAAACDESIPGIEGLPLPPSEQILLEFDGRVRIDAPSPPGDDAERMRAAAMLLKRLLGLDASGGTERTGVPGALLVLLARAFGTIDLPAPSFEDLCRALGRFGSGEDRVSLRRVYARSTRPETAGEHDSTTATPLSTVPARQMPERRQHGARVSDLRRELRIRDREIFEALARQPRRARGVPLVAALAICALALSAGGLLMRGAMDLLDREPLVQPRSLIEQVPAVSDRAPAPSGLSPAAVSAATQRSKSASTAGSNIAPEPLLVTGSEIDVFSPSFGPDGSLLFHRGRDRAALMRAWFGSEGVTEVKTLLEDGAANYHAVLSPDGERLAYDSDRDGTRAVYVARRDGGNPINVSGDGYAAVPRWAPDCRRLAFIRSEPSRPRVWNVWIANLESEGHGRVQRLERPDPHPVPQPRPQPRQRRHPGHRLRPDGARAAHLPAGEAPLRQRLDPPPLGEARRCPVIPLPRQAGHLHAPAVEPERPDPREQTVQLPRQHEPVGARCQPSRQPVPQRQRVRPPDHARREPLRVAERKVEPDEHPPSRRQLSRTEVGEPCLRDLPVPQVLGLRHLPVARHGDPDSVLLGRRAPVAAARPIDHGNRVERRHNPSSRAMKSATASVASRPNTGRSSSSATSAATARIVGSSGAISGLPAACRYASTLG
jgi:hypothetical protein